MILLDCHKDSYLKLYNFVETAARLYSSWTLFDHIFISCEKLMVCYLLKPFSYLNKLNITCLKRALHYLLINA